MEWCEYLSGSFFGILYLYLWYNHTISVSNGCVGGISPCDLFRDCVYCFQSHLSLSKGMVMRYLLVCNGCGGIGGWVGDSLGLGSI